SLPALASAVTASSSPFLNHSVSRNLPRSSVLASLAFLPGTTGAISGSGTTGAAGAIGAIGAIGAGLRSGWVLIVLVAGSPPGIASAGMPATCGAAHGERSAAGGGIAVATEGDIITDGIGTGSD